MEQLDALSDRSVTLALQELAEEFRSGDDGPRTDAEAQQLVESLLASGGYEGSSVGDILNSEEAASIIARRLLEVAVEDPDVGDIASEIVAEPPTDEQLAVETAVTGVVVLAALITWLQTKVDIRIRRKEGKTDFDFHLTKGASSERTVQSVAQVVTRIFFGGS